MPQVLRGRHVLYVALGFFAVVAAVNAVFVYVAISTFSGLDTEQPYVTGLAYNDKLEAAAAQKARGWQVELRHEAAADASRTFFVTFAGRDGSPIGGLDVALELRRPTHEGSDLHTALEPLGGGRYGADLDVPLPGQWQARLRADRGGETVYRLEQRLWLK